MVLRGCDSEELAVAGKETAQISTNIKYFTLCHLQNMYMEANSELQLKTEGVTVTTPGGAEAAQLWLKATHTFIFAYYWFKKANNLYIEHRPSSCSPNVALHRNFTLPPTGSVRKGSAC